MKDTELQIIVLRKFYEKREEGISGGFISVNEKYFGSEISRSELFRICEQLAEKRLIEFKPVRGDNTITAAVGKITAKGIEVIENANPEEIRDQIRKLMCEYEDTENPQFLSSKEIADKLGLEDKDVRYHLKILERDQYITQRSPAGWSRSPGGGGRSWDATFQLTPSGKQRVKEGHRPVREERETTTAPVYVDSNRLDEIRGITSKDYDLSKLIRLCEELNIAYANDCFLSVAMLMRVVLDHVPPIFGCKNFKEVANNYSPAGQSFRGSMQNLENSLRHIADAHLHKQIRRKESLPNRTQVNFASNLDVLLSEILAILG